MRTMIPIAVFVALFSLVGCNARSLNPVVGAHEATAIDELVGVWQLVEDAEWPPTDPDPEKFSTTLLKIEPADVRHLHTVVMTDPGEELAGRDGEFRFELALMRENGAIVGHIAMGKDAETEIPDPIKDFLVQVCFPVLIEVSADRRWMAATFIDTTELESSFESGAAPIACVRVGESLLISAAPSEIREFLRSMPERYREGPLVFRRQDDHP